MTGVGPNAKADAQVIFRGVQDSVITEETYESDNLVWFKNSGEGSTVTTLKLPSFTQTPYVKAPGGIQIDVGFDLDQQQAKEQIAFSQEELGKMALDLAKQPGFEYIADLDAQGAINWQAVALIQDYWEYENEGLTAGAAMLISLAVAVAIGPGAGALFGGAGLGGATAGALVGTQGALYTGLSAGFTGLYTQAAVSLVNNKGDIGATLDQLASSDTVRSFATAAITAGANEYLYGSLPGSADAASSSFSGRLANELTNHLTTAAVNFAVNDIEFEEALITGLRSSLANSLSGFAFENYVSNLDGNSFIENLSHKIAAASVGCLSGEFLNSDCGSGALGAAIAEAMADYLIKPDQELITADGIAVAIVTEDQLKDIRELGQLTAGAVALALGKDVDTALSNAELAVSNNATGTPQELIYEAELDSLWIDINGDIERYYEGVSKIADRDSIALDILMFAYPVSFAGGFSARTALRGPVRVIHKATGHRFVSTGRTIPKDVSEQIVMDAVKANPKGTPIMAITMNDTKNGLLAKDGWIKMQQVVTTNEGRNITIHWAENTVTKRRVDFKFAD